MQDIIMRMSVDQESLLGRLTVIEKLADQLRFEAVRLREAVECIQAEEVYKEPPEE